MHMAAKGALHGAEQGIVKKSAALNHHMLAQLCRILDAQHLVERIAHHRITQASGNVGNGQTVFLRLSNA